MEETTRGLEPLVRSCLAGSVLFSGFNLKWPNFGDFRLKFLLAAIMEGLFTLTLGLFGCIFGAFSLL
jgi:hypothetical protein